MARRTLYPQQSSFVNNPNPPVQTPTQFGWFPKWQDPVRNLVAATAVFVAFCPQPPKPAVPRTAPIRAEEFAPVRLPVRAAENSLAWNPQPAPSLPVTPSQNGFDIKWQDVVRIPGRATESPIAFDPRPPPALPVTPTQLGFNPVWQDPVRLPLRGDSQLAWSPEAVFTYPSFGWFAQWQDPVRLAPRALDAVYIYDPQVIIFTTPVPYGWAASQFAPTLLAPRALDAQFAWNPQKLALPITPTQFGFYPQWQDPVRLLGRATESPVAWSPEAAFTHPNFGWLPIWQEPVRVPARAIESPFAWEPQVIVSAVQIPYGWAAVQFAPTLLAARALDPQFAYNFRTPPALPVTPSQFGFWKPFHDIVRTPERRDPVFAWTPQVIVPPAPAFGWWTPQYASDPVKLLVRATPSDLLWTPKPLILPVTPSQFGWWVAFHDLVRTPLRGDVGAFWYPQPVIPFRNDWLVTPYSSAIPSLVCSSASIVPALVCYGGAVVENETYMSTLLPFQIQQPFILFPGNGVPVQWEVILGSTYNTTQTPVTDCTGTLTIYDQYGNELYEVDFTNLGEGIYQAMIDGATFDPAPQSNCTTVISLTSPTVSQPAVWTIPTNIRNRNTP